MTSCHLTHYPDGRRLLTDGQHTLLATGAAAFFLSDADLLTEFCWQYQTEGGLTQ